MGGSGQNNNVPFKHISAVTLAVRDMPSAVGFYEKLGMDVTYGGGTSGFTTMRSGDVVLNLILSDDQRQAWWGRVIQGASSELVKSPAGLLSRMRPSARPCWRGVTPGSSSALVKSPTFCC